MNTNGHYDVVRFSIYHGAFPGQVHSLKCAHCAFSVDVRALHRTGDKSGASRYCRARARMVKHLHAAHFANLKSHGEAVRG